MRIVVVEDNRTNLLILSRLSSQVDASDVVSFDDPCAALTFVLASGCDLVLVDYMMPAMNGVEFIRSLRGCQRTADIPSVMITSEPDRGLLQTAIAAGATDFLTKPVDPVEFKARVRNLLALRRSALADRSRSEALARAVEDATRTIVAREQEMMLRMARAIECRDGETGAHVERIAHISRGIAETLGLADPLVDAIHFASPMHDIGKLAVPDAILRKPGPLTAEERLVMQQHTVRGHAILCDSQTPLLQCAAEIALCHHEHVDGAGYPNGLRGSAIPLPARIVAVADVFDALTSARPYKAAWSRDKAMTYLVAQKGTQFDPACVEAFARRSDLHRLSALGLVA